MTESFGLRPPPMPPMPEPAGPSKGRKVLIGVFIAVVIVAVALAGGAFAAGLIGADDDPQAAVLPSAAPPPSAQATTPGLGGSGVVGETTVVVPPSLGGKPRVGDGAGDEAVKGLFPTTARAEGVYGDKGEQIYVLAVAAAEPSAEERAATFSTVTGDRFAATNLVASAAGPLGGSASCGTGRMNGKAAAVCLWSGDHTNGILVRVPGDADALAERLPALRAEVEQPV